MPSDHSLGCLLPQEEWLHLNRTRAFENEFLRADVAPFPPQELMHNVSGLQNEKDFASHGVDIWQALTEASPIPLVEYTNILDFGCGCGRLARMFKGHPHRVTGCDIDPRHVKWVQENLTYIRAVKTSVLPPLPFTSGEFDAIISISVFTHLNEKNQDDFLAELHRISSPNAYLFLTVHGSRALQRAIDEPMIRDMVSVEELPFQKARESFDRDQHAFILQEGHLTTNQDRGDSQEDGGKINIVTEPFEYGITFIPEAYIRAHWSRWFEVVKYCHGAIHSFQDIVVLKPK